MTLGNKDKAPQQKKHTGQVIKLGTCAPIADQEETPEQFASRFEKFAHAACSFEHALKTPSPAAEKENVASGSLDELKKKGGLRIKKADANDEQAADNVASFIAAKSGSSRSGSGKED